MMLENLPEPISTYEKGEAPARPSGHDHDTTADFHVGSLP
jgi:hypothetical protein